MNKIDAFWTGIIVASIFWTVGIYVLKAVITKAWGDLSSFADQFWAKNVTAKVDAAVVKLEAKV
jgi:hypothetical protein